MDQDTKALLERAHSDWRRVKFGVAALGCAAMLAGCGGGSDDEPEADAPPARRPVCGELRERCL
jgi:hypothetical protein